MPGVEFSVRFKNNDDEKVVHVISVFSDKDEEKVKSKNRKRIQALNEKIREEDKANGVYIELKDMNLELHLA